ncbi:MAG: ATP-dependent RNA helicase SrmB [Candidatus Erwinia impunctatus]|nr:ATP-dependent RNA helicase SrmB [Culicoides impunctatus]
MINPPVSAVLPDLLEALQQAPQVVLTAPTGAGKSTWLPLQLLQWMAGNNKMILLEPRRLAARNVAQRLAEQLDEQPGETVGYRMRGENCIGPDTRLSVVTEGVLTRMLQQDPELQETSLVLLDEFHERSLQGDLALTLLLDIQQGLRDDLKIVVMSATLDNLHLQAMLPQAKTVCSQGRSFPVERRYQPLDSALPFEETVARETRRLLQNTQGALLLFLPGVAEIQRVQGLLAESVDDGVDLCPLYGGLPLDKQRQAIIAATDGRRKVVLATNIAETSLTIEGISVVVDSALERSAFFDVRSGVTRLQTQRISQASMAQRAGRAGRLAPGVCLHLLDKSQAERCVAHADPEILHSDLTGLWLNLLFWGCSDPHQLQWLDEPPPKSLAYASQLLQQLGAVDEKGKLTPQGRAMAQQGQEPRHAAMMLQAANQPDACATAALLVAILENPPRAESDLRDCLLRPLAIWKKRAAQLRRDGNNGGKVDISLAALLLVTAYPDRIARRRGDSARYQMSGGTGAVLEDTDPLMHYEWLVVPGLLQTGNRPDARILQAFPIDIETIITQAPSLMNEYTSVSWDDEKGTLNAWRIEALGEIKWRMTRLEKPPAEQLHSAMLSWIREKGLAVLNWSSPAEQLRCRIGCAATWLPQADWPEVTDEALLGGLEQWLLPAMSSVSNGRELKQVDCSRALLNLLTWPQRELLESELPTHYTVPTGSRLPLRYAEQQPPVLAVRLQEMFGEATTPRIAQGNVPLILELLSPAQRPLQITRDLTAFWQGAYREVQKEMKGRYPKHPWPDNPTTALPTRRTKK